MSEESATATAEATTASTPETTDTAPETKIAESSAPETVAADTIDESSPVATRPATLADIEIPNVPEPHIGQPVDVYPGLVGPGIGIAGNRCSGDVPLFIGSVTYTHPDGRVNVAYFDHEGRQLTATLPYRFDAQASINKAPEEAFAGAPNTVLYGKRQAS